MSFHMNFFQNLVLLNQPHYKIIDNLYYFIIILQQKTTQEIRFLKNQYSCIVLLYYPIATNDPPMLVS